MNIKQKITAFAFLVAASVGVTTMYPSVVHADCAGVQTSIVNCTQTGNGQSAKDSGVWGILLLVLNILTAGVGIVSVGSIGYAAILYSSAGDNPAQVKEAKDIIKNVIIGIVAYGGMYLLLNFIIPGGIFS